MVEVVGDGVAGVAAEEDGAVHDCTIARSRSGRGWRWTAGVRSPRWRQPVSWWKPSIRSRTFLTVRTWASPRLVSRPSPPPFVK